MANTKFSSLTQLAGANLDTTNDRLLVLDTSDVTQGAGGTIKKMTPALPAGVIGSGTLVHERGGLEADASAFDGLVKITGGVSSAVSVSTFGESLINDVDAATARATLGAANTSGQTFSGRIDFSGTDHSGLRLNTLTTAQRDALTPADGDALYNSTVGAFQVYYSAAWNTIASGISWGTAVNADIVPDADGTRDLGTTVNRFAELHVDSIDLGGVTLDSVTLADPGADRGYFWDDSAGAAAYFAAGTGLAFSGTNLNMTMTQTAIVFQIDGGGSAITTGVKGYLEIPFACTITAARALCDQTGSIVVDIWKDTYANYPPVDADSITSAAPVTVSSATKSQDTTLTGWTTSIAAGDILAFNVDSITTVTQVTISLTVTRTS